VGSSGITALKSGNYVVASPDWANGTATYAGAVTWCSGSGFTGAVTITNSLVGSQQNDYVGSGGITALESGNYVVASPKWANGTATKAGAVTWESGTNGATITGEIGGVLTPQNSIVGTTTGASLTLAAVNADSTFCTYSLENGQGTVQIGLTSPNQLTCQRAIGQTTIIPPSVLTSLLNAGSSVVLQANSDITVNDSILVSAGGAGGSLTLQAGRNVLVNAPITTDNGALILYANANPTDCVVSSDRLAGPGSITLAAGVAITTGTGQYIQCINGPLSLCISPAQPPAPLAPPFQGRITFSNALSEPFKKWQRLIYGSPLAGGIPIESNHKLELLEKAEPLFKTEVTGK
jgi:hypothetical protein